MATLVALLGSTGVTVGSLAATTSSVLAWGPNVDSQLGPQASGSSVSVPVEVEVAGMGDVVAVAAGTGHSLALRSDGTVWSWGRNRENELGDGERAYTSTDPDRSARAEPGQVFQRTEEPRASPPSMPTPLPPPTTDETVGLLTDVKAVAAGWYHSLAVKRDGTVWAWGDNRCGQLGNGRTVPTHGVDGMQPPTAGKVPGLSGVVAVAAGRGHSLALDDKGALWSWGDDRWGQLGSGRVGTRGLCTFPEGPAGVLATRLPGKVALSAPVVAIAAGSDHSLAITAEGTVWSWGNNCSGQLGPGPGASTTSARSAPIPMSGLPSGQVVALAAGGPAGGGHSLALTAGGGVWAWGVPDVLGAGSEAGRKSPCKEDKLFANNGGGADVAHLANQVARTDPARVADPTDPSGFLSDVVALDAGTFHTLAVRRDGVVFAWGRNDAGQLGPAGTSSEPATAAAKALDGPVGAVGAGSHSLALPGPPPRRPTFDFSPGADDLPVNPDDLPGEDDLPVNADDLPGEDDVPVDPEDPPGNDDVPDDPAGLAGDREGPVAGSGGGVLVSGSLAELVAEDPDCSNYGCNTPGARHFLRRSVAYVTPGDGAPHLLLVPWTGGTTRGMVAAGFRRCRDAAARTAPGCFDVAYNPDVYHPGIDDAPPENNYRGPLDRDLRSVRFGDYDAVIVGTRIFLADLDILVARQHELSSYVNAGGGLVAFSNCFVVRDGRCVKPEADEAEPGYQGASPGDPPREIRNFDFLPFLRARPDTDTSPAFRTQAGATVTDEGRALGLTDGDISGNYAEAYFESPCGFDPLVRAADGRIVTMATRKPIPTPCVGANVPDVRVNEGDGGIVPATFSVTLGTARDTPVRVDYATIAAGAAGGDVCPDPQTGGADYLTTSGTLTFPAGDTGPLTVSVPVCGDRLSESDENFLLRLTSPDDPGLEVTAAGTIVDDEPNPPGDVLDTGTTPGGGDRGENAPPAPVQPAQPVQVPAPAPAPAAAGAPAVALAPALAPAPAPAQGTSQAQAQQGSKAQAQAGSPAHATAASPQVGMATDEQRQTEAETAKIDSGPDELLASERRPDPTAPLALLGAAAALAVCLGGMRRGPARERETEPVSSNTPARPEPRLWLRRVRQQR